MWSGGVSLPLALITNVWNQPHTSEDLLSAWSRTHRALRAVGAVTSR